MSATFYRQHLRNELESRIARNQRYSLRSFSKSLGVDVSILSKVLSAQMSLPFKTMEKVLGRLDLSSDKQRKFRQSVLLEHQCKLGSKYEQTRSKYLDLPIRAVSNDSFKIIADWYHYAILELSRTNDFDPSAKAISKRLGISETQVTVAIQRLIEIGLLKDSGGVLKKCDQDIDTSDKDSTNAALKIHAKQMLKKAATALDEQPLHARGMIGMTMAIDPEKIPKAKKMILEFRDRLCTYLESGDSKKVYQLQISLFGLETTTKEKEHNQ